MSAHILIPPHLAGEIVGRAQFAEPYKMLADFGEAGIVKGYARLTEIVHVDGRREEVRDKRITREMWRRIVAEDRAADMVTGTIRLTGSAEFGGGPKVTLIGIGFDDASTRACAIRHGAPLPLPSAASLSPTSPTPCASLAPSDMPPNSASSSSNVDPCTPNASPARPSATRKASKVAPGAQAVTIDQAVALLNIGRTTIYAMAKRGELVITKIGNRSLISMEEIDRLLGKFRP